MSRERLGVVAGEIEEKRVVDDIFCCHSCCSRERGEEERFYRVSCEEWSCRRCSRGGEQLSLKNACAIIFSLREEGLCDFITRRKEAIGQTRETGARDEVNWDWERLIHLTVSSKPMS